MLAPRTTIRFVRFIALMIVFASVTAHAKLPKAVNTSLAKYEISESSVSAIVVPLNTDTSLLSHYPKKPRNPASVMKLLTTFAALDILGPAYGWKTKYFINGTLKDGVLDGDLIIKGAGDPYLVKEQFWLHLAALREQGLKTINGNLLIDNSAFSLAPYDSGAFDKQPTRLYNVGASATVLNFNASRFRLRPDDGKIQILLDPPVHNIIVNNQLKPTNGKCHSAKNGWSMDVVQKDAKAYVAFTGSYNTRCGLHDVRRAVLESKPYLYGLFAYLWRNLGGEFSGGFGHAVVKEDAKPIYVGGSKSLAEVINGTNKYSNNLLARQLLLTIGHHQYGEGAAVSDGVSSVKSWLQEKGLKMPELVMENGAGLSRQISLSAESLASLLRYASNSIYHPEFLASFSLGGMDGTMKKRMKKLQLGGRARLKTGYIKGVRSLAGYMRADSGKDYAIVLFIQDPKVNFWNGNQIQDAFVKWVLSNG